jgi:hypothetical protein
MRTLLTLITAMILLAAASTVRATARLGVGGGSLRAGVAERIEWSGLPEWADEVELELSLDGGRWVRVSPELEAREGGYSWVVPEVGCGHARLRLRAGGEHHEEIVAVSDEFGLESSPGALIGDDWWHLGERHATATGLAPASARFSEATGIASLVVPSRVGTPAPDVRPAPASPSPASIAGAIGARPPGTAARRAYPLRN